VTRAEQAVGDGGASRRAEQRPLHVAGSVVASSVCVQYDAPSGTARRNQGRELNS